MPTFRPDIVVGDNRVDNLLVVDSLDIEPVAGKDTHKVGNYLSWN